MLLFNHTVFVTKQISFIQRFAAVLTILSKCFWMKKHNVPIFIFSVALEK